MTRIIEIIRTELSDGNFIRISKFGRKYSFMHSATEPDTPPESHHDLTRSEAYKLFEDALKKDVLETD